MVPFLIWMLFGAIFVPKPFRTLKCTPKWCKKVTQLTPNLENIFKLAPQSWKRGLMLCFRAAGFREAYWIYIYIYIYKRMYLCVYMYSVRFAKPGGPETWYQTFSNWGAALKVLFNLGVSWITFWHHFGVHLRVRNGLGTKMAPESIQLRKGTTPGVESYFFLEYFLDLLGKMSFQNVFLLACVLLVLFCIENVWIIGHPEHQ